MEPILFESSNELDSKSIMVILSPTTILRNLLPHDVTYTLQVLSGLLWSLSCCHFVLVLYDLVLCWDVVI